MNPSLPPALHAADARPLHGADARYPLAWAFSLHPESGLSHSIEPKHPLNPRKTDYLPAYFVLLAQRPGNGLPSAVRVAEDGCAVFVNAGGRAPRRGTALGGGKQLIQSEKACQQDEQHGNGNQDCFQAGMNGCVVHDDLQSDATCRGIRWKRPRPKPRSFLYWED